MVLPSVLLLLLAAGSASAFSAGDYDRSATFASGNYELHWNYNSSAQTVRVAVRAQTAGWVAMGLGEVSSGSMPGADILSGYVDASGVAYAHDRFATAKATPPLDDCQSWQLLDGEQQGGWTTIEAVRAVSSGGDTQDRDFTPGIMKIIWAYGTADTFDYHGGNRGPGGAEFFGGSGSGQTPFEIFNSTMQGQPGGYDQTIQFPSVAQIPPDDTTYFSAYFEVPTISQNQDSQGRGAIHIVALAHYVAPATAQCVHHIVIDGCYNVTQSGGGNEVVCESLWAWAPGIPPLVLPAEAGFRAGQQPGAYWLLKQEVHYDNPTGACTGLIDNSGVVMYYDTTLRANDAGTFTVGDVAVKQPRNISQGTGRDFFKYDCPASCTSNLAGPFNVFGTFLHMHNVGASSVVTQWRSGVKVRDFMRVEFWDFAFQNTVPQSVQILPGDVLKTTCTYHKQATREVKFQDASEDEMCLHFIYGWPRPPFSRCGYYFDESTGLNSTSCGQFGQVETANPTLPVDPDTAIYPPQFGAVNPTYQCPGVTTSGGSSGAATSSSSSSGGIATTGTSVESAAGALAASTLLVVAAVSLSTLFAFL